MFPSYKWEGTIYWVSVFQSPFSGDFLCFLRTSGRERFTGLASFNLHFQETFFVSTILHLTFSYMMATFNLHFQETFFVSKQEDVKTTLIYLYFQSPFSGDFLCFNVYSKIPQFIQNILSISIFRRLSLFPSYKWEGTIYWVSVFQSPFSGDFLCFLL